MILFYKKDIKLSFRQIYKFLAPCVTILYFNGVFNCISKFWRKQNHNSIYFLTLQFMFCFMNLTIKIKTPKREVSIESIHIESKLKWTLFHKKDSKTIHYQRKNSNWDPWYAFTTSLNKLPWQEFMVYREESPICPRGVLLKKEKFMAHRQGYSNNFSMWCRPVMHTCDADVWERRQVNINSGDVGSESIKKSQIIWSYIILRPLLKI